MKNKPFPHHYLHQQHHHQQQQKSLSDEVDSSRSSGDNKKLKLDEPKERAGGGDGSTIEVVKRPRGRPPGSKNKPKLPLVIAREEEPSAAMRPHVLEIPAGHDVVDSLAWFSRRRNLGICVLSGTGAVENVTLRQPYLGGAPSPLAARAPATIVFRGRFEILSMSATFLPPAMAALSPAATAGLSISLAGPQGQVVGGTVAGPLVAARTVVVVAAAFSNPTFHRLPAEDMSASISVSGSGGGGGELEEHEQHLYNQQQSQQEHRQRRHQGPATTASAAKATESSGMSIYGSHVPSDVIWATTARPPPPPPF